MKTRLLIITLAFTGYLFSANSDNFTLVQESDSEIQLNFLLGNFEMVQINGESRVITGAAGKTMEAGLPELPVFTTFIEVKLDRIYSVDYSVESSTIIQDIRLVPATIIEPGAETIDPPQRNEEFYLSGTVYPQAAVSLAEPMIMRNVKILAVKVIPFNYNPGMSELEVFDELNITIRSTGIDPDHVNRQLQPSGVFEELYSSILLNHEPADRSEYQTPAVLYICGGGSSGVIQHPYFQQLVEWRHKRGWVVYTAHTGTTGSGSNQIKNYIEDAYDTFDPPPEIVALVGDVGGTFTVPTFYENWSWYSGEGDHPYSLLDGDDILPEVLVGRISVNSSSDVSNVINKTLHYEKALYMGNNWFEKGAVASDPNDSGMSVADVGMYVEQLMDAHGMEDVRLKIQGSSWASWMENQLDEGLLYFHYRGWGLFSGFDSGNIYALNNGFATPFISFITCGTGSFAQGTSLTEDFIRVGSVNSPKGGVTAIGTATLGTHTVFNNILDMGIWEGVFAKDLDYAGSALASGKLALLTAYPSDPDNKVSMFTHWNNLMGDPALNLWTDTPKIIIMDHPESVGIGSNYIDVQILDEYENPVTDAVVTAVTDNDEIFVSVYTGEDGIAEIPLPLDYSGNVDLTVTKKNCKPVESEFSIYDDGPVVNIDENNLTQDEISGNNDGLINPGEAFSVTIPVYNFGDESAENVAIHVESSSDLLELDNPDGVIAYLEAGGTSAWELTGTVLINAMETDEIQLTVFFMDGSGTQWSSRIPLDLHSPVLIVNGYQIISGGDIEPGSEIELEIFLSNLGTQSVSNVSAMLNFPGYLISFEDSLETWDEIMPGETAVCQGTVVAVFF
ncbi:MAG: hypothetical protein H8D46_02055 [FCB group bacterium]|nr:hypothetical protein [FCB group bacterium]